jgi:hypothetical protein
MSVRFFKSLLVISIIINLLLALKYQRDKLFENLETDIVFLGNSITQHYEFFEFLTNPHVRNIGI